MPPAYNMLHTNKYFNIYNNIYNMINNNTMYTVTCILLDVLLRKHTTKNNKFYFILIYIDVTQFHVHTQYIFTFFLFNSLIYNYVVNIIMEVNHFEAERATRRQKSEFFLYRIDQNYNIRSLRIFIS